LLAKLQHFLAKTVREHLDYGWNGQLELPGSLVGGGSWMAYWPYFDTLMTSAAIEAVNGVVQLAKRMARGFRNFVYFMNSPQTEEAR
jgi:Transposase